MLLGLAVDAAVGQQLRALDREQRRRLLRYARENTKKKAKDEPVSLEEKKVLEDVLQEFFA